jgi:N-6 DNA Methylase
VSRVGITVEGGLIATDLIERIALGDESVPGQKPKDFGLEAGRLTAEIQAAFSDIRVFWDAFKRRREHAQTSPVTLTREAWVIPLLERLDYVLRFQRAGVQIGDQRYPLSHWIGEGENAIPVHIVAWNQPLGQRGDERRSPHALLQEFLNRSDALWGIVTNGRELRLLRNNARSSRPSYVAIDLETILDGNLYNEFALAYRLLHRSRLPAEADQLDKCLLETWYQQGIEEGGRVRRDLRNGVKAALEILGSGFLGHPDNGALRAKLDGGQLTDTWLYRELLNLIYRLLFLMVAEERRLLFVPPVETSARHEVYLRWYGIGRLRERTDKLTPENGYSDLWEGFKETFRLFRDETIAQSLALSALNGELFGNGALRDLEDRDTRLRNSDLLEAIRQLSTFNERTGRKKTGVPRRVNYAGLDVEELGSIYESLLDYHPQVLRDPWRFALAAGSQRKETGSYYTPPELVRELVETALLPVMQDRLAAAPGREEKERALLSLTICDPAAGSGHFLLAAARRVARELAIIRSGEAEPAPEIYRAALRDVIRHCLYAVDKNPLAVDLCKVALWIEGHAPGLPLSFLDHRIRCGDSLVGVFDLDVLKAGVPDDAFKRLTGDDPAVCAELRRINRRDRSGELAKFSAEAILAELAGEFAALADMPDETPGDVRSKEQLYRQLKDGERVARLGNASDAWTAAFFAPRGLGQERTAPTTADVWNALNGQPNHQRAAIIDELSERFRFFHWRLEFPEVFARGGFDVMLGNPPWEVIEFDEPDYLRVHAPLIADLEAEDRRAVIAELSSASPNWHPAYISAVQNVEQIINFLRCSERFGKTTSGKLNSYALFAELSTETINRDGRAGLILQSGIATDTTNKVFFNSLLQQRKLFSLFDMVNTEGIFPGIHRTHPHFCLATICGKSLDSAAVVSFHNTNTKHLRDERRAFPLYGSDLSLLNPNTEMCPIFRSGADANLTRQVYQSSPILVKEARNDRYNHWSFVAVQNFFSHTTDGKLFLAEDRVRRIATRREANWWCTEDGGMWLPLYEGKMIDQYDHRFGSFEGRGSLRGNRVLPPTPLDKYGDDFYEPQPHFWVTKAEVDKRIRAKNWTRQWFIGWKDITTSVTERTVKAAVIPYAATDDTISLMVVAEKFIPRILCVLANFNSIILDFVARQKVSGLHLRRNVIIQMPVLPPELYTEEDIIVISQRAFELSYTSHALDRFAEDMRYPVSPYRWDPDRRVVLKAELDAYFAYLYGLSHNELRYILDPKEVMGTDYPSETFRVLKENECRAYGEYRTRRLVLEAWDRFAEDGTFDPARLRDPTHFDAVQKALVETKGRVQSLERELRNLLARSDATPLPTLFVEGESDVVILTAAWRAFYPTEKLPVTILAAGGTRQMESLAGKGGALRQVLGDRLVFSLADNDREGRDLVEHGQTKKGGQWRQQSNGIHWCLLAPTAEFEQAMKRFGIPDNFWPFTIENAFPAAVRQKAIAEGAYAVEEATVQAAYLEDPATAKKALTAAHQLALTGDAALLYFRPPSPETKLAFAKWLAAPERRDRGTFGAFGAILEGLRTIVGNRAMAAVVAPAPITASGQAGKSAS